MKDYTASISWREKLFRCGIHIPVGIFNVFCVYAGLAYGILFFIGFFMYEFNEDWHLKDKGFLDIFGWIVGFGIGVSLQFLLSKLGVI